MLPERAISVAELASSSMIRCESSDDGSVRKKWLAHASAIVAGSDVSTPLTVSAGGREIDLNLPENDARALNVSPEVALDLKSDHALHFATRSARWKLDLLRV